MTEDLLRIYDPADYDLVEFRPNPPREITEKTTFNPILTKKLPSLNDLGALGDKVEDERKFPEGTKAVELQVDEIDKEKKYGVTVVDLADNIYIKARLPVEQIAEQFPVELYSETVGDINLLTKYFQDKLEYVNNESGPEEKKRRLDYARELQGAWNTLASTWNTKESSTNLFKIKETMGRVYKLHNGLASNIVKISDFIAGYKWRNVGLLKDSWAALDATEQLKIAVIGIELKKEEIERVKNVFYTLVEKFSASDEVKTAILYTVAKILVDRSPEEIREENKEFIKSTLATFGDLNMMQTWEKWDKEEKETAEVAP